MSYQTLISTAELAAHVGDPDWAIVDCRFVLTEPETGRQKYLEDHIPGAVYAHLDQDLSGPIIPGKTGRHPLPSPEQFAEILSNWGIGGGVQVVAYDDGGGVYAGRLWWMLRWMGHDAAAVLDGDWRAWQREGRPITAGREVRNRRHFVSQLRPQLVVGVDEVLANLMNPAMKLLDARGADRYRGENETLDPIGGHIPGALSAPYAENLTADGHFRAPEMLRSRFESMLGDTPIKDTVFYCGSGVSAAHDLLALAHIGMGDARLYVGSWSEWSADSARPIAQGPDA